MLPRGRYGSFRKDGTEQFDEGLGAAMLQCLDLWLCIEPYRFLDQGLSWS